MGKSGTKKPGSLRDTSEEAADEEPENPLDPVVIRRELGLQSDREHQYYIQGVFCPKCSQERRLKIDLRYAEGRNGMRAAGAVFFAVHCPQCTTNGIGVICEGPEGDAVSLHWPVRGVLSTPNSPPGVAYYLDQAARCETAGAHSAAVAMYRAALDHLMFNQNYRGGMLGVRLGKLLADVDAGNAPKWARDIDHAYLDVVKRLGDGAIHTNDGDVTK